MAIQQNNSSDYYVEDIQSPHFIVSPKGALQSSVRIPEGYLLLSQNGEEEGVLTHIESQSIKYLLIEHNIWEEVIGSTLYGGSSWSLKTK
ncbi:hypothetical protein AB6G26_23355 [Providencia hangzhouensis]|uniref:hypothetical protein n=1 Tax=Providencia hangzhouensis TaxID=3031799 RepID=UPI0034DD9A71